MHTFNDLVHITDELRSEYGYPWDKKQAYGSLKIYLANESQEVYDAIDNQGMKNLYEGLGNILLRMMLHNQIAKEEGVFTIDDVVDGVCQKMIRRHPHIFGDVEVNPIEEDLALWNAMKKQEKTEKP